MLVFSYNSQDLDGDENFNDVAQDDIGTRMSTLRGMDFSLKCFHFTDALNRYYLLQQHCLQFCKGRLITPTPIDQSPEYYENALKHFMEQVETSKMHYQLCLNNHAHLQDLKSSLSRSEALIAKTATAMVNYFNILPRVARDVTCQAAGNHLNTIFNLAGCKLEESGKRKYRI